MSSLRMSRAFTVLAVLMGLLLGLGAFTFYYAEGFSYMSNDPSVCTNCHIMNEQYDSWAKSGHRHVAVCNDCHLPHAVVPKFVAKARNGYNHSAAFTLQNFPEPIMISRKNADILQANCLHCHGEFVHDAILNPAASYPQERQSLDCIHCHRNVGHGPTRSELAPASPTWLYITPSGSKPATSSSQEAHP